VEKQPPAGEPHGNPGLLIAFGATLLLSASLLFSVQPLVGKLLLPLLGGAPAVWNTVMLFFQAMLLAGYAYAHFSFRRLGIRSQPLLHFGLLLIAAVTLPFVISSEGTDTLQSASPAIWVLLKLTAAIGIPVFVLASTAPLLQKWFACSGHRAAADPYFLYAASNIGSFGALFAYPLLAEPFLPLQSQVRFWSVGFWLLALCIVICAILVRRASPELASEGFSEPAPELKKLTVFKWIGLAFVPSSLMLGVTNYITTDVASVPLLWVLPLALYLFTFVIAFSKHSAKAEITSSRSIPILALAVVFLMVVQATEPVAILVLLHLFFFFFAALQCHLKLSRSRPPAAQLTEFYLYMSVGGVLGGIFNALIAPYLFSSILEYPLMILAATLIGFPERTNRKSKRRFPPIYGGALIILSMSVGAAFVSMAAGRSIALGNILAGVLLLGSYLLVRTPVRYTLAIGILLACTVMFRQSQSRIIERERNFFGVLRVANEPSGNLRRIFHGTTIHGVQFTSPERRCTPLSYYHSEGPVGEITRLFEGATLPRNVGLIGLGAGAMVTFGKPDQTWDIYEIDPAVIRIAQDTNYFTYLSHCARAALKFEVGDARLRLKTAAPGKYGLLYLDAFSSDVIPIHLLTIEALRLYRQKVAPDGILAFHLSSRHFDLEPLVANLGHSLGLQCFLSARGTLNPSAIAEGGFESTWAILIPESLTSAAVAQGAWTRIVPPANAPFWTDDFSSLLGVLKLN
jgi:hypothetical protein